MADYDAGRIFLTYVASAKGISASVVRQANRDGKAAGTAYREGWNSEVDGTRAPSSPAPSVPQARRQGQDSGGAFADAFRKKVEAAARSLPPLQIGAATSEAEQELRDLREQLDVLSSRTVGVDLDGAQALAEVEAIEARLRGLQANSASIPVRADVAAALAQLAAIGAAVEALDANDVEIDVRVDSSGLGLSQLDTFSGRILLLGTAIAALAPAAVPVGAAAAGALAGIGAAGAAGVAGVGVLALGLSGVGDAVKALGEAQATAAEGGAAHETALRNLDAAMGGLSASGRTFAEFLFGLRPQLQVLREAAQEGLLPGLQAGIEALLPAMPALTGFVGGLATALGGLGRQAGEALLSPAWSAFFDYIGSQGAPLLTQLVQSFGFLALGLANLLVAFEPVSAKFVAGLLRMATAFADWAAQLTGNAGFQAFIAYLFENAPVLLDALSALGSAFVTIVKSMAPFGPVVLEIVTAVANFIAALPPGVLAGIALAVIGIVVAFNTLLPVIAFVSGIVTAAGAGMTVMGAIIAALGGPITLVIVGLVALGAALIAAWKHSETFRDVVTTAWRWVQDAVAAVVGWFTGTAWPALQAVWNGIAAGATWLWQSVLVPAWEGIRAGFAAAADGVMWVWQSVLKPVIDAVAAAGVWLWQNVLQPTFSAIVAGWTALVDGIRAYWEGFLRPVFELVGAAVTFLWNVVMAYVFAQIREGWAYMVTAVRAVWLGVLEPTWRAVGVALQALWTGIVQPVLRFIGVAWDALLTGVRAVWQNVLAPTWTAVGVALQALWNAVVRPVLDWIGQKWDLVLAGMRVLWQNVLAPTFQALRDGVGQVGSAFDTAVTAIGIVWDQLREKAKAPVRFVVDQVINGALIDNFNRLADFFGTKQMSRVSLPVGFADGGVLPGYTPGRDVHRFYSPTAGTLDLSGGEPILRPEVGRVVGRGWVDGVNAAARSGGTSGVRRFLGGFASGGVLGGFASGGIVAFGRLLQSMGARVSEHPSFGGVSPVHKGRGHYEGRAIDVNTRAGTSALEQRELAPMVRLAQQQGFMTIFMAPGHYNHAHIEDRGGGKAPTIGGKVAGFFSDLAGSALSFLGNLSPVEWLKGKVSGLLREVGSTPIASVVAAVPARLLDAALDKIRDLGDFAGGGILPSLAPTVYDSGGYLPPGLSTVFNGTRAPEPVFTGAQAAQLAAAARRPPVTAGPWVNVEELHVRDEDEVVRKLRAAGQDAMTAYRINELVGTLP